LSYGLTALPSSAICFYRELRHSGHLPSAQLFTLRIEAHPQPCSPWGLLFFPSSHNPSSYTVFIPTSVTFPSEPHLGRCGTPPPPTSPLLPWKLRSSPKLAQTSLRVLTTPRFIPRAELPSYFSLPVASVFLNSFLFLTRTDSRSLLKFLSTPLPLGPGIHPVELHEFLPTFPCLAEFFVPPTTEESSP